MLTVPACRICAWWSELARVRLRRPRRGRGAAPSAHVPGDTATCSRCHECGTVQQPSLPAGRARCTTSTATMRDDAYLAEEAGPARDREPPARPDRRATCPRGRLLDVGCGHGLLLDEARRRGYEVDRAGAVARGGRARPRVARPRRARAARSRTSTATRDGFDVDRARRRARAPRRPGGGDRPLRRAAAPGGVLCVVTPDPSSRHRAARGRALVGLPARAHLPAAAPHAARAADRARGLVDLRGRAARAHVRGPALGRAGWRSARPRRARRSTPRRGRLPAGARCRCRWATSA